MDGGGPDTEAPRAPKMAERVLRELRRQIATGELAEGSNLPTEAKLVEQFGVSRTPIREAMRVLEMDGLIDSYQGARKGALVRAPTTRTAARYTAILLHQRAASLADVYRARMGIEPLAAGLLAEIAPADGVGILKALYETERQQVDDRVAWGKTAAAFHLAILEHCGNQTLFVMGAQLHDIVAGQIATEMSQTGETSNPADRGKAAAAHARLIGLVEAKAPEKAEAFWRKHMEAAWPWYTVTQTLDVEDLLK